MVRPDSVDPTGAPSDRGWLARLPFAAARYDRRTADRADPHWWEREAADPRTRVLVVGDGVVATREQRGLRWLTVPEAETLANEVAVAGPDGDAVERMLLGTGPGGPVLAVSLPVVPERLRPRPVRAVATDLDDLDGGLLVQALGLANWHRTHQHCAQCGAVTGPAEAGHVRRCPRCQAMHFPRTDPAVIMLITDDQDRALLGHSPDWPDGRYSTLAGFVEPGESLEDAVRREVAEEVGVRVGQVTYAASQPWPFPSSLMLGFFGRAESTAIRVDGDEVTAARWFSREELTAAAEAGTMLLPGEFSISRWLVTRWHGRELPGRW